MTMLRTLFASSLATPVGPLWLAVDAEGALAATAFGDLLALQARAIGATWVADAAGKRPAAVARQQLADWFRGARFDFDLPLAALGSPFQQQVWQALRRIPAGQTRSYGELATELGSSPRAVGRANATNPIAVVVPCHRVIGADGSLTGFAFGVAIKQWLLDHERRAVATGT
jgi:methylated-DNA-[protein]-cysteine S-methyltransferase